MPRADLRADGRRTACQITLAIDRELFRAVAGAFPTGVTVVTTVGADGAPRGLTSNAVCAVSLEPPLLLFCLNKKSNSLPCVLESRVFVVNFLAAGRGDLATRFASQSPDRFAGVRWEPSEIAKGAPILVDDVIAHAECALSQAIDAGDHYVLIGHVEGASSSGGYPLMYFRRTYAAWPDERPAPGAEDIRG